MRLLLVDDDPGLRELLRTTFEIFDLELDEADSAAMAARRIAARRPDVIVLDVLMPGIDGVEYAAKLKVDPQTAHIPVVLLTGSERADLDGSAADEVVRKPFSPLELLGVVERLAGGLNGVPLRQSQPVEPEEQLLLYASDLRHLLEIERQQRALLNAAYHDTVVALAGALESKDTGTRAHSERVQLYAVELARACAPELLEDPSIEYGFVLHDVGKIGIPDNVLQKPAPLSPPERRLIEKHTILGEQMLEGVSFMSSECLSVVRSHHERWDGQGYPDGRRGDDIPLGARVFAVADALDAITSDRPYRREQPWDSAVDEIVAESGKQFDPHVVEAFRERDSALRAIRAQVA
ncbi:MAG TPA: HD domain-containing phosphohydrolase [Gaiellaceae bacterium]|jgi:ribonuclease P protein subunit RPR2|nr:HD domain-containing phosphohydrolase [Gaiellaceae bacterium]